MEAAGGGRRLIYCLSPKSPHVCLLRRLTEDESLQESESGAVSKRRVCVQQALPTTGLTVLRELGAGLPNTTATTLLVATTWWGCVLGTRAAFEVVAVLPVYHLHICGSAMLAETRRDGRSR